MFTPISSSMKSTNRHVKWHRSCLQFLVLLFMWAFLDPYNPRANIWFVVAALQELCFYRLFLCSSIRFGSRTSRCLKIFVQSLDCSWAVLVLALGSEHCPAGGPVSSGCDPAMKSVFDLYGWLVQMIVRMHSFPAEHCTVDKYYSFQLTSHCVVCCIISYHILSRLY